MAQVETHKGTVRGAIHRASFMRGFREARKGLPMDYDAFTKQGETNDRWAYERGRLLAIVFQGDAKRGTRVTYEAVVAMSAAVNRRCVI